MLRQLVDVTRTEGYSGRAMTRAEGFSGRVTRTEGYSGRVIRMLCQLVGFFPVERASVKFDVFFQDLTNFMTEMRL